MIKFIKKLFSKKEPVEENEIDRALKRPRYETGYFHRYVQMNKDSSTNLDRSSILVEGDSIVDEVHDCHNIIVMKPRKK